MHTKNKKLKGDCCKCKNIMENMKEGSINYDWEKGKKSNMWIRPSNILMKNDSASFFFFFHICTSFYFSVCAFLFSPWVLLLYSVSLCLYLWLLCKHDPHLTWQPNCGYLRNSISPIKIHGGEDWNLLWRQKKFILG